MTKKMNKVIAAMMTMAITFAMPAMAGNKKYNDKNNKVVVVINNHKGSHFDKNMKNAYRPEVKACTFRVSRHDSHRMAAAKAVRIRGVMDTKWNPRTREMTVIYDAKVTSPRYIRHFMA